MGKAFLGAVSLAVVVCLPSPGCGRAEGAGAAAAAKAAFKACAAAAKAGNQDEVKRYIAKNVIDELEENDSFDLVMGMVVAFDIDEFTPNVQGDTITFEQRHGQGEGTLSISFTMVQEGGQWKVGK